VATGRMRRLRDHTLVDFSVLYSVSWLGIAATPDFAPTPALAKLAPLTYVS
jgi:hypothetical protein